MLLFLYLFISFCLRCVFWFSSFNSKSHIFLLLGKCSCSISINIHSLPLVFFWSKTPTTRTLDRLNQFSMSFFIFLHICYTFICLIFKAFFWSLSSKLKNFVVVLITKICVFFFLFPKSLSLWYFFPSLHVS